MEEEKKKKKERKIPLKIQEIDVGDMLYHKEQERPCGMVIKKNRRDRRFVFLDFEGSTLCFAVPKGSKSDVVEIPFKVYRVLGCKLNKERECMRGGGESVMIEGHPAISGEYIKMFQTRVFYSPNTNLYLYPGHSKSTEWRIGLEPEIYTRFTKDKKKHLFRSMHRVAFLKDSAKAEHPADLGRSSNWESYVFDLPEFTTIKRPEKQMFVDLTFLPIESSLDDSPGGTNLARYVWKRASELFPGVGICDQENDGFEETDVFQGQLGTCYVLSCMSSLARSDVGKKLLRHMFRHNDSLTKQSVDGKYIVELHVFGVQKVVVDDFIPCVLDLETSKYKPAFTYVMSFLRLSCNNHSLLSLLKVTLFNQIRNYLTRTSHSNTGTRKVETSFGRCLSRRL